MPQRQAKPHPPADENVAAHRVMQGLIARSDPVAEEAAPSPSGKHPGAVALGGLGGLTRATYGWQVSTPGDGPRLPAKRLGNDMVPSGRKRLPGFVQ